MNRSLIPLVITLVSWQLVGCGGPANDTGSAKFRRVGTVY